MDGEFASLQECMVELPGAPKLNLTSANEHEPYIKRRIRVVKERVRSIRHSLPFKQLPKQMTIYMVFYAVKLLNYFPIKGGVSDNFSPKAILAGEAVHFKYYSMPFGTYCQIHEEDGPQNSMAARTQGAIVLGPSGNMQGGHKFLSLQSGRVVTHRTWTILPMPNNVIDHVGLLGANQPFLLTFQDRHGDHVLDELPQSVSHTPLSPPNEYDIPGDVTKIVEVPGVDTNEVQESNVNDFDITPNDPVSTPLEPPLVSKVIPTPLVSKVIPTPAVQEGVRRSTRVQQAPS